MVAFLSAKLMGMESFTGTAWAVSTVLTVPVDPFSCTHPIPNRFRTHRLAQQARTATAVSGFGQLQRGMLLEISTAAGMFVEVQITSPTSLDLLKTILVSELWDFLHPSSDLKN